MRTLIETLVLSGTLLFAAAPARPAEDAAAAVVVTSPEPAVEASELAAEPSSSPPTQPPPAPPQTLPAPPAQAQAPAPRSVPAGQWVYTNQYGWVWMPYGDAYTYAPPSGYGEPYEYVYYPAFGWTWVVAPWVWGWGPWPHFGLFGPWRFAWFGHGWWRNPGLFHFAPTFHRGGFVNHGVAPAPFRGGGPVGRGGFFPRGFGGRGAPPGHAFMGRGGFGGMSRGGHVGGGGHGGGGHR